MNNIIKKEKVLKLTVLSSINQSIEQGKFPKQIKPSARSNGWVGSEVIDWKFLILFLTVLLLDWHCNLFPVNLMWIFILVL